MTATITPPQQHEQDDSTSVLITGASSGVGYATVAALLREDPTLHLVLALRDDRDHTTALRLAEETGNHQLHVLGCDLASLASVRAAIQELDRLITSGTIPALSGVIANAGVQTADIDQTTVDGFELTFGVNVLGHYTLIRGILENFPSSPPPRRIVLVTSSTHWGDLRHNWGVLPAPRWRSAVELAYPEQDDEGITAGGASRSITAERAGLRAYTTSKLALIYLTHELARRVGGETVVYSFNPGMVPGTGIARYAPAGVRWLWRAVAPGLRILPNVADATTAGEQLAALFRDHPPAHSGAYVNRGYPEPSSPESYHPRREHELWRDAAKLVGIAD